MSDDLLLYYEKRKTFQKKTEFLTYLKKRLIEAGISEQDWHIQDEGKGWTRSRNVIIGDLSTSKVILTAHYDTCPVSPLPNIMAPTNLFLFLISQFLLVAFLFLFAGFFGNLYNLYTNGYFGGLIVTELIAFAILFQMVAGFTNPHTANDNSSGVLVLIRFLEQLPAELREQVTVVFFDNEEKGLIGSSKFAKAYKDQVKEQLLINFDCVGDGTSILSLAKKGPRNHPLYQLFVDTLRSQVKII